MPRTAPRRPRAGVPNWKIDERFKHDVFTFVRVEYDSGGWRMGRATDGAAAGAAVAAGWTDWPDSDLNFSFRLQQLTSLKVNPDPITLRLTDEQLFDYPFLYMIEPGGLYFSEEEVMALRRYLLNGGFLMVDDFWGDYRVGELLRADQARLPRPKRADRAAARPRDLPVRLPAQGEAAGPQHPHLAAGLERDLGETTAATRQTVHYKGIFDDKDRMMVIICHNTDLGDGWEREGENADYFHEFSEKKSYPMGINIVTYAMTH